MDKREIEYREPDDVIAALAAAIDNGTSIILVHPVEAPKIELMAPPLGSLEPTRITALCLAMALCKAGEAPELRVSMLDIGAIEFKKAYKQMTGEDLDYEIKKQKEK